MAGGPSIYDDIIEALEKNGDLGDKEFRRFVLFALVDLGRGRKEIDEIKKKVERLERNSLILIARKYSKASIIGLVVAAVFTIFVADRLGLWQWLLTVFTELTGIPLP